MMNIIVEKVLERDIDLLMINKFILILNLIIFMILMVKFMEFTILQRMSLFISSSMKQQDL